MRQLHRRSLPLPLIGCLLSGCLTPIWTEPDKVGVLVLAHGGSASWNAQVEQAMKEADLAYPTEIAFGMGMEPHEVSNIQQAVQRLEASGIKRILVVPLLVSSHSSVYRQYQYLLGLREDPSWPDHPVDPIKRHATIQMGRALDDSSLVAQILLERALALCKTPSREALLLVAHGPEEEADNQAWLYAMEKVGVKVQQEGRFAAVAVATLQDDAPGMVREEATRRLRAQVNHLAASYRVLVIPLLISQNGIEGKIQERLKGLSYVYTGETLLPHQNIAHWLKAQVESIASETAPQPIGRQSPPQ